MKKIILTISMMLTFSFVFGIQEISAQAKGKVIYTQGSMTGQATLKGSLSKKKWMYFGLDFPDGKPAFNIVGVKVNFKKQYHSGRIVSSKFGFE